MYTGDMSDRHDAWPKDDRVASAPSLQRYGSSMRVAHVVPRGERPTSGVFTALVHLAAALSRRGHRVSVWSLTPWGDAAYGDAVSLLDDAGVTRGYLRTGERLGSRLIGTRAAAETDLVHLHGAFNRTSTLVASRLTVPYVFSPHGGYDPVSLHRSALRKRLYLAAFERRMLRKAAAIAALTPEEERHVRELHVGSTPTVVIPNGVEPPARVDATVFRRSLGIGSDEPLAVFVGRLDIERKGLDRLLAGVAASPSWQAALVGPEERGDLPRLHQLIRDLGLAERVTVCGPLHGVPVGEALAAADLFVLLSRWEGLPLALLEALSHGTPALVSDEVDRVVPITARGAGWSASPESLGPTLDAIAHHADERTTRGKAAIDLSRSYDWDEIAGAYDAAYQLAVRGAERRRTRRLLRN
jgi:glycosyltransferase involved in cell wall biosynthesis